MSCSLMSLFLDDSSEGQYERCTLLIFLEQDHPIRKICHLNLSCSVALSLRLLLPLAAAFGVGKAAPLLFGRTGFSAGGSGVS